jgi:phytoene/squalene synthetase
VSEQQNVQQQSQDEQVLQDARDFFGQSMGRILGQMESDYAQLQSYMQQLPDDTQAPVQQMTDSYNQFAGTITQAAQDAGVQDSVL